MLWTVPAKRWRWPSGAVTTACFDGLGDADRTVVPRDNRVLGDDPNHALERVIVIGPPQLHRPCLLDPRECIPIEPRRGREGRQRGTAVSRIERDMRFRDL